MGLEVAVNKLIMNRLIIAGSRSFDDYKRLKIETLDFILEEIQTNDFEIVCGMAQGADLLGKKFAGEYAYNVVEMPAKWDIFGRKAGPIRNEEMAKISSHCIIFWDKVSNGTANMIANCKKYNLIYKIIEY